MFKLFLSLFTFSLGLMPLNNNSYRALYAPFNPKAYESIMKNAADKSEIVKMIFDCRLDPSKCILPSPNPSFWSDPSIKPFPHPSPTFYTVPSEMPSPFPCWKFGDCPIPLPDPTSTTLPKPSVIPTILPSAIPYPMPEPSEIICIHKKCIPSEPPIIIDPPDIDSLPEVNPIGSYEIFNPPPKLDDSGFIDSQLPTINY